MNKLVLFTLIIVLFGSCQMESSDCKKYFAGKWKYNQYEVEKAYVVRTLSKQIEYVENGKYHYDFDIKWLSDCKYQIIYRGTNSPKTALAKIGETTTVEILAIDSDDMKYHTVFKNLQETGKMTRF